MPFQGTKSTPKGCKMVAGGFPTGYRLTDYGTQLLPHAQRVEAAAQALEQHVDAARRDVSGVVRVTCPEPLVSRLSQSAVLERFHARYPALRVEFVMSDKYLDLRKGEADVALRSGDTDDGELVGRKIGDSIWAVYASRDYIERHGAKRAERRCKPSDGNGLQFTRH